MIEIDLPICCPGREKHFIVLRDGELICLFCRKKLEEIKNAVPRQ